MRRCRRMICPSTESNAFRRAAPVARGTTGLRRLRSDAPFYDVARPDRRGVSGVVGVLPEILEDGRLLRRCRDTIGDADMDPVSVSSGCWSPANDLERSRTSMRSYRSSPSHRTDERTWYSAGIARGQRFAFVTGRAPINSDRPSSSLPKLRQETPPSYPDRTSNRQNSILAGSLEPRADNGVAGRTERESPILKPRRLPRPRAEQVT